MKTLIFTMTDPSDRNLKPQPPASWGFAAVCLFIMLAAVFVVWLVNSRDAARLRPALPLEGRR